MPPGPSGCSPSYNNHLKSHFVPFGQDRVAGAAAANERRRQQAEAIGCIVSPGPAPTALLCRSVRRRYAEGPGAATAEADRSDRWLLDERHRTGPHRAEQPDATERGRASNHGRRVVVATLSFP